MRLSSPAYRLVSSTVAHQWSHPTLISSLCYEAHSFYCQAGWEGSPHAIRGIRANVLSKCPCRRSNQLGFWSEELERRKWFTKSRQKQRQGGSLGTPRGRTPFLSICTSFYFCCGGERAPVPLTAHTELRGKLAKASSSAAWVPGIELPVGRLGGNFLHWSSYHPGVTL